jgi:hypothetical protein
LVFVALAVHSNLSYRRNDVVTYHRNRMRLPPLQLRTLARLLSKPLLILCVLMPLVPQAMAQRSNENLSPIPILDKRFGLFSRKGISYAFQFTPTTTVPLIDDQTFGWRLTIKTDRKSVSVREEFELPAPAGSWGGPEPGKTISEDGKACTRIRSVTPDDKGYIRGLWSTRSDDPEGPWVIRVFLDDSLAATFQFTAKHSETVSPPSTRPSIRPSASLTTPAATPVTTPAPAAETTFPAEPTDGPSNQAVIDTITGPYLVLTSGKRSVPISKGDKILSIKRGDKMQSRGIGGVAFGTPLYPIRVKFVETAGDFPLGMGGGETVQRTFYLYQDEFHEWKAVAEPSSAEQIMELGKHLPSIR